MSASSKYATRNNPSTSSRIQPFNRFPGDVQDTVPSREATNRKHATSIASPTDTRNEDDPNLTIQTRASHIVTQQDSVATDHRSRIMQRGGDVYFGTTHFSGGGHAFGGNNTVINNFTDNNELKILSILTLPRAQADYKDYEYKKRSGACFPGTREALLREMEDWVNSLDGSRMYVLSGLAGIGKSTVAYSIAERAEELGLLGASFFFSRDEVDRKNATKFFTTIAYQLCVYDKTFEKAIQVVLLTARGHAATTKSPLEQLQILIVEPLRRIVASYNQPILVVVDALDECDEADERAVVMGLSQLVQRLPTFKVILTTRPQSLVSYLFGNHSGHQIFYLQNIEEKIVDADIRLYLSHSLSREQVGARLHDSNEQWFASDEELDSLVQAAGRLFIIASTAVRLILDIAACDPAAQIKKLLGASAESGIPFKDLNEFYYIILRNVVPVNCDKDVVNRYQSVIGAILFVQQPLPVGTLACLISREAKAIRVVLNKLQSVILLGRDDIPHVYHKSFHDYITNSMRCQDVDLCVGPWIHHTRIATRCFEIMDQHLKYNILGLGDPARFMDNEAGLEEDGITDEQMQEKIPQQLGYACVYWANHLEVANMENADLITQLENFAHEHLLHWFEVLSLIGKLGSAHIAIRAVMRLLSTSSDLHQLFSDALRFISKFYGLIEKSALHTYYSALPFTPTGSLLYRRYIKEAMHNVWDVDGGPEHWDALVASPDHGEYVTNIKFSLDSTMFVSHSDTIASWYLEEDEYEFYDADAYDPFDTDTPMSRSDSSEGANDFPTIASLEDSEEDESESESECERGLKIWDAATGTPISAIPGQKFAVANDFSTIASSEGNTIMLYNVNGSTRNTMFTTSSSKIEKLTLSSESSRVAAALFDGTICLWDTRNAELINSFKEGYRDQLEFSPTGTILAYRWVKRIVTLRDGISGRFIADLECGTLPFVFSADGSRLASLDDRLALWNSDSGELIGISNDGRPDHKLAISANGSLLATASTQVTLWSENGGQLQSVKVLDEGYVRSIALLRDNILAIASNDTLKLYDINTHSFVSTLPFTGNIGSLTFSPNSSRLASPTGSTVSLWDIQRIEPLSSSQSQVIALAFSRDCSRLACGFKNGSVELWGAIPTVRRIETLMQRELEFDPFRQYYTGIRGVLAFSPEAARFLVG